MKGIRIDQSNLLRMNNINHLTQEVDCTDSDHINLIGHHHYSPEKALLHTDHMRNMEAM